MKALQNKPETAISIAQSAVGTGIALPSQPAETPQQKDTKTMAWYSQSTVSGSSCTQQHDGANSANAASAVHANAASAESTANPIIARAFAMHAALTEAY